MPPLDHAGIWPALLTPLTASGAVDVDRLAAHARQLLDRGCSGLTLFGTTGEGPSFSVAERQAGLEGLLAAGIAARQLLVHTSAAALPDALALSRHATERGVHGCLLAPPFFIKGVSDQGVSDSLCWVFDQMNRPDFRVVLYHIPQVTGVALSQGVIAALLARYPGQILGIKDSGCQRAPSLERAAAFMPPVQVWVGNEPDLPVLARCGSRGAVSGLANLMPERVRRLVEAPALGQSVEADEQQIGDFLQLMGGYALVPALKGVQALLTGDEAWLRVRPPLVALAPADLPALHQQLQTRTPWVLERP